MTPQRVGAANVSGVSTLIAECGGRIVSVPEALGDQSVPASMIELIEGWDDLRARMSTAAPALEADSFVWEPPVIPRKLVCVGANYVDHVEEMARAGAAPVGQTTFPFSFLKPPTTALIGSDRAVAMPGYGDQLDWEAELAVVIGRPERAATDPMGAVFGYTILNDLSLRDFVAPFPHPLGLDAVISKGFDGAAPMGPWITVAAHAGDPSHLAIELRVNGEVRQRSSTEQMIFPVAELVAYYARVLTLEVGDVIATGTPAGVGAGMQPPEYLTAGDEIEIEIEGLGCLRTPIGPMAGELTPLDISSPGRS
jgi:2-keto-4-pentenoate hydratase/2-oxohepta-3-ene-1,7-dioic acid hydratase in catechol pathway